MWIYIRDRKGEVEGEGGGRRGREVEGGEGGMRGMEGREVREGSPISINSYSFWQAHPMGYERSQCKWRNSTCS